MFVFFFKGEDGIRDLVRSGGLGDVYKRQCPAQPPFRSSFPSWMRVRGIRGSDRGAPWDRPRVCLLYTSDAADERSSVDLGGRRIIKKKNRKVA